MLPGWLPTKSPHRVTVGRLSSCLPLVFRAIPGAMSAAADNSVLGVTQAHRGPTEDDDGGAPARVVFLFRRAKVRKWNLAR